MSALVVIIAVLTLFGLIVDRIFRRWRDAKPRSLVQVPKMGPLDPVLCMSATALSRELRAGRLRSVDVVRKHIAHIRVVNPHLNAVVFDRFDQALEEARVADEILAKWRSGASKEEPGWLTGVPCTIKECFAVVGCPNTAGHPHRVGFVSKVDAPPVQRLRAAGAIVLGVTNLSEMCMWMESANRVYGATKNPHDVHRIVGGSSGGEGAAVAAHFAPFGLGSDIGGSIRMPAYFNGVIGHKPSTRLVPNSGQHPGVKTEGHFLLTTGPICRYMEDLMPLMRTLADGGFLEDARRYPWCNAAFALGETPVTRTITALGPATPTRARAASRNGVVLRVYAVEDFAFPGVTVSAAQRAAVRVCAEALEKLPGVTVVRLNLKHRADRRRVPDGWATLSNGAQHWAAMVARDEVHFEALMAQGYPGGFPAWTELVKWILGKSMHTLPAIGLCLLERIQHKIVPASFDVANFEEGQRLKAALWRELADDGVIIAPTYPVEPPRHNVPILKPIDWQYTALFNAMEMPATAVPVWLSEAENGGRMQRLPLGVQVAAGWGHDNLAMAVASKLVDLRGGVRSPSWTK